MKKLIQSIFQVKSAERTKWQIIFWWELRRILYNLIVLIVGLISLFFIIILAEAEPGEDVFNSFAIFLFGIMCNVCYTLGWFTEMFAPKSITYGPKMFKIGLAFTLFWVLLPAVLHITFWIFK